MPDVENQAILLKQLRGHLQELIKQIRNSSILLGLLVAGLIGGTIKISSLTFNFAYGSIIIYLIICFRYLLCLNTLNKLDSITEKIGDNKAAEVLSNEPGILNPFARPYWGVIYSNALPMISAFVVTNISVPVIIYNIYNGIGLIIYSLEDHRVTS